MAKFPLYPSSIRPNLRTHSSTRSMPDMALRAHYGTVDQTAPDRVGNLPTNINYVGEGGGDFERPLLEKAGGKDGLPTKVESGGGAGFGFSVFNVMNAILGSGILGLAYALKESGFVPFFVLLFGFAAMSMYTIHLLLTMCDRFGITSYEEIGMRAFGKWGQAAACAAIIMQNIGGMCSYLIIDGDLLPDVFLFFLGDAGAKAYPLWLNRKFLVLMVVGVIVLPLALLKKIGFLAYSSSLSVFFSAAFAVVVVVVFPTIPCTDPSYCHTDVVNLSVKTFFVLPIIAFSFQCHTTLLPVYHELKRRTKTRMQWVGNVSVTASVILYALAGLFGYLTFQQAVTSDLLKVYATFGASAVLILLTRIAIAGAVTLTVPLLCFPSRKAMSFLLWGEYVYSWKKHSALTAMFIGLATVIALWVPDVKIVFGFAGATSATALILMLPGIFYLKLSDGPMISRKKAVPLAVVVFGVVLCVAGVTGIIVSLVTGDKE